MKRALLIVNPAAGEARPAQVGDTVRAHLQALGWQVSLALTERAAHATEIAAAHGRDIERLVVVGGDGTLRETFVGLAGQGPPVGLVPMGKANVMARELGIPRDAEAAMHGLETFAPGRLDVGTVNDTYFLAMVGVGYDGVVTEGVRRLRVSRPGAALYGRGGANLVYGLAGVPALFRFHPPRMTIVVDGQSLRGEHVSAVVSNTATYATGWSMTPDADPADGILDHTASRRATPWFVLWSLGAAVLWRRLPPLVAEYGRGRAYRIRASRPLPWQVDGDSMPRCRELQIGVRAGFARILAPPVAARGDAGASRPATRPA